MRKFFRVFLLAIFIFNVSIVNAYAESENSTNTEDEEENETFSLKEALSKIKKKESPVSIEVRSEQKGAILRYKNIFLEYNYLDKDTNLSYTKLTVSNELISMMGTGFNLSCGATGVSWKEAGDSNFSVVPTAGIDFYMTVMSKVKFYAQFSGMPIGGSRIYDTETGLRYTPIKHLTITAGYRHFSAKVHRKDNYNDFQTTGPFIGLRSDF